MPTPPIVGQDFKTAGGQRASVFWQGEPDVANRQFGGKVIVSGNFQYTYWTAAGVNVVNAAFNLASEWPTTLPTRYQPIMPTQDGTWRIMTTLYTDLDQLKSEWVPKGCAWAVTIDRDVSGFPTVTRTAIS